MWPIRRMPPRGQVIRRYPLHLSIRVAVAPQISGIRLKSWSPFSRLKKQHGSKTNASHPQIVIEEPDANVNDSELVSDLKHYLKTADVPKKLRRSILTTKLTNLIETTPNFDSDNSIIPTVNSVFMELYKLNDKSLKKGSEWNGILPFDTVLELFKKSAIALLNQNSLSLPEFMSILARVFVKENIPVPADILVYVVELASLGNKEYLAHSVKMLIRTKRDSITPELFTSLLDYHEKAGSLDLNKFESIMYVCHDEKDINLLDDQFYARFIKFIENIYVQEPPLVHEYLNNEKNLQRIQYIISTNVSEALNYKYVTSGTLIKLAKLSYELDLAFPDARLKEFIKTIFQHLENENSLNEIRDELFKQNLGDETLAEELLAMAWSTQFCTNSQLREAIVDYIVNDDVKFSAPLILQSKIYCLKPADETQVLEQIKAEVTKFTSTIAEEEDSKDTNYSDLYTKIIQALMVTGIVSPRGPCIDLLTQFFRDNFPMENTIYAYKYRLDAAIQKEDYIAAVNIFDDSLVDVIQWTSTNDPSVQSTLNNLIVLLCLKMNDINTIFPIFTKIKQQMVTQCNVLTIKALAPRMMQAEYVGDLIEMMKRELPKIEKESKFKLPSNAPYGGHYRELFDILHNFVISYNNEETHETNWVLYGELHKYFYVPYDSYLPAIKFFCTKDRLNASLVIFRQIKMLSELHGQSEFLPPSRDMYLYLFGVYGDKLYEDGVKEIHEYLKMDVALPKQDIALQNCVLNAYSNLQDVPKARDLFLAMSSNPKLIGGINEETVQIMIKTYTYSDFMYVKEFWNNLSHFGIVPNYSIFKQYLIAHVYHGLAEQAIELTEEMNDYGIEFSSDTLLSMYNLSLDQKGQELIADWAKEKYPQEWIEVSQSGLLKSATNYAPDTNVIAGHIE